MELTKPFSQLGKNDAALAGGKGASLGEMTQAGIPVPPGFVILADTFERFIEETKLVSEIDAILSRVNHHEMETVEKASEEIQALILSASVPHDIEKEVLEQFASLDAEFVAVRSSATAEDSAAAAWAGQLDTFLNTTKDTLLENVRRCWASLFTPRAIFYRFEKGLGTQKISVAVVVQKMINSDAAGIAFSVHPVTENHNQMIIEAGYGLGEAIVSGQVTPDSFIVTKAPRKILEKSINKQAQGLYRKSGGGNEWRDIPSDKQSTQVISDEQVLSLAETLMRIEKHYGFPVDTEWAMENDQLYIVQSRPITTLSQDPVTQKTLLVKSFSREHSLFYTYPWRISNCEYGEKWLDRNIEDALYMRPKNQNIVEVWYGAHLFDTYHADIAAQINKDSSWFPRLASTFKENWKVIFSYINKHEPLTRSELEDFYTHWINWWEPMAIMMELPEIIELSEDIRDKAYELRAHTQEHSAASDVLYLKYIEKTHPELATYYSVLTPEEVFADTFPIIAILEERLDGWLLTSDEFHLIKDLPEVLKKRNFELETAEPGQSQLKGQTAYKGIVQGKVRIVQQKDQVPSVQDGEIIVSPMTTPEFMPALQRAAAFVTDEGGITCHAAIIARELKKPCITGTKFATQILKTGDEVEVDADNGIVRILSLVGVRPLRKEDIHVEDWEFEAQQRGEQPILLCDFFSRSLDRLIHDMTGLDQHYDYLFTDSDKLNHSPKHREIVLTQLRKDMLDRKKRHFFLRNSIEVPKQFNAVADEVEKEIADPTVSNQTLAKLWRDMDRDYLKVVPWFYYPWYVSLYNLLTDPVKEGLEKHRAEIEKICDLDEAHLAVVFPTKKTNFQLEQDEMLKLVAIAENNSDFADDAKFKKAAAEYLKKYDYLTTFILAPLLPMTYEQLVERVQTAVRESFKENYSLQKETTRKNEERAKQILKIVEDDQELMEWIEDSRELGYVLTAGIEEAYMSSARYLKFMQLVAERIGVKYEDIKYLFSNEISGALEDNKKVSPTLIDERRGGFVLMMKEGMQYAAFGTEGHAISEWADSELNKIDTTLREFSGQTACKGYGKGIVRIATTPQQAHQLKEGEVLVCPMTNPDYVPAMRRSVAIVTDEGGMLSHAGIMSREFGKPCVIGTKIATQLLKNGDLVEVDADNGIVRILSNTINSARFEREYTRDTTALIQELWGICCTTGIQERFGIENPFRPQVIHYMNEGSIEVWENKEAIQYLMDAILEKNTNPNFLPELILEYKTQLEALEAYWKEHSAKSAEVFEKYLILMEETLTSFIIYYYSAVDERTPENLRHMALKLRDVDNFFVNSDTYIRDSLIKLYPDIKGYETAVLRHEVKAIPDTQTLKERRKHMILIDGNGIEATSETLSVLAARKPELQFISHHAASSTTEVKGQTAYKGVVRGKVRVVRRRDQIPEVQEGEIIVSPMTTPDFIAALQKAAAIVTDEGGITCHAAIVARELKKPCIIGTQIATQVFSNGMEIEVDADNGVVRILNQENEDWPKSADYLLTFEGKGLRALLTEIVTRGYCPPESFVFYENETYKQYYSLRQVAAMGEEGKKFFSDPDKTREVIEILKNEFNDSNGFKNKFSKGELAEKDVRDFFAALWRMNELYMTFDFAYTDKAYEEQDTDAAIAQNLKLVEENKNPLREKYNAVLFESDSLLSKMLQKLSSQFEVSVEDLQWYVSDDLFNLYHGEKPTKEKLSERQRACAFYRKGTEQEVEFFEGEMAVKRITEFGVPEIGTTSLIKGITANAGSIVRGEAYVLNTDYGNFEDLKRRMAEMKQGQILVAATTAPEHMDAIRKAAAIVVDMGGLLSHTAIVSRELGIPSIVGTQHASKIIKTGDTLEVDASRGEVRVL